MRHSFFDKYSYLDSPVHRLNPTLKIAGILFISVVLLSIRSLNIWLYLVVFSVVLTMTLLSKIPVMFVVRKTSVVLPFVVFVSVCNFIAGSFDRIALLRTLLNATAMVSLLVVVVGTTRFHRLLEGLARIGVPKTIIVILSFIYRYFFVLIDEAERMIYSAKVRMHKRPSLKVLSTISAMLFVKSYERSERIYWAMLLRGYNGKE